MESGSGELSPQAHIAMLRFAETQKAERDGQPVLPLDNMEKEILLGAVTRIASAESASTLLSAVESLGQ